MDTDKPFKSVVWLGNSRKALAEFSDRARREVGFALHIAQLGGKHHRAKPLKGFSGVYEVVTDDTGNTYRAAYVVNLGKALYVLHVFQKKSKSGIKTPPKDLQLIEQRLKEAKVIAKEIKP